MPDKVITSTGDCSSCCGGGCYLTMPTIPFDFTDTPYADEATAIAAIATQAIDCLAETTAGAVTAGMSASVTGSQLDFSDSLASPDSLGNGYLIGVTLAAAGNINLDYSISTDAGDYQVSLQVIESDGVTPTGSDGAMNSASGTLTVAAPAAGFYFVVVSYGETPGPTPGTSFSFSGGTNSDAGITFCTIRAAWDDGGGVEYVICV